MSVARRTLPGGVEEVLRLRRPVIDSVFASDPSVARHGESLPVPGAEPGEPDGDFRASVVDHPERPGRRPAWWPGRSTTASARRPEPLYVSLGFRPEPDPLPELAP
ncbi:hypothetical protein [Streptomyces luteogriseus]|uniref:hypothetical protein n=1 Tax=Streptomyces luteogriseus TaxID=68233 RepID=UPI0036C88973